MTTATAQTRYQRLAFGTGLDGWIYGYENREPISKVRALATGLEIEVQLAGEWTQTGHFTGARCYSAGTVRVLSPGELYSLSYAAKASPGLQVGFILYPGEMLDVAPESPLLYRGDAPAVDRRLLALARELVAAHRTGAIPSSQVADEIRTFALRTCTVGARDPLVSARQEIARHYNRELYVGHFADMANMHPVTFSRAFARRFGITPARFRLELRLNAAARLLRSGTDITIEQLAEEVGFNDLPYFHRAFLQRFGRSPAAFARSRPLFG